MQVNVNTATIDELRAIEGIGDLLAFRIVVERTAHGPYVDLKRIWAMKGIGPKKRRKLALVLEC